MPLSIGVPFLSHTFDLAQKLSRARERPMNDMTRDTWFFAASLVIVVAAAGGLLFEIFAH